MSLIKHTEVLKKLILFLIIILCKSSIGQIDGVLLTKLCNNAYQLKYSEFKDSSSIFFKKKIECKRFYKKVVKQKDNKNLSIITFDLNIEMPENLNDTIHIENEIKIARKYNMPFSNHPNAFAVLMLNSDNTLYDKFYLAISSDNLYIISTRPVFKGSCSIGWFR